MISQQLFLLKLAKIMYALRSEGKEIFGRYLEDVRTVRKLKILLGYK